MGFTQSLCGADIANSELNAPTCLSLTSQAKKGDNMVRWQQSVYHSGQFHATRNQCRRGE